MANPFARKASSALPPRESEVTQAVHVALAHNAAGDAILDQPLPAETREAEQLAHDAEISELNQLHKLSKLVDDDFPFDESQLRAIEGMTAERFACLTGAAGTGKTTTTKKLVDRLLETTRIASVNMETYWGSDEPTKGVDAEDDYEAPEAWVPAIAMCAFTGRATQMTKKNFPEDWHGNIMTIHRLLGFIPDFYDDFDEESQSYRKKMRFVPTYTEFNRLPWDTIVIDEAGMLGLDLWHQLWAACKPGCRVYMIGDINQLPPVHGRSVFGFALAKWPAWELTHVHRQQGVNNPIVDNAWRVLHGRMPVSEGRFQMIEIKDGAALASKKVQGIADNLYRKKGIFDPIRDCIITPINGEEGSRGRELGQLPLNERLALLWNFESDHPRYIIDAGRERRMFAVGDKVMATRNDYEAGITNGMTGIITSIAEHAGYAGDRRRFGRVAEVNAYLADEDDVDEGELMSMEDLEASFEAIDKGQRDKKEKKERGPASHIVTVQFGNGDHSTEIPFQSLAEVASLMTAYVVTCHKMQGGEAPVIIIILHDSHKAMLYREWLYTAITRASQMCIVLYSQTALRTALNKQSIKGSTLQEKVQAFNALQDPKGLMGAAVRVVLPESDNKDNRISDQRALAVTTPARLTTQAEKSGGLAALLKQSREAVKQPTPPSPAERMARILDAVHTATPEPTIRVVHVHTKETIIIREKTDDSNSEVVDGGALRADPVADRDSERGLPTVESTPAIAGAASQCLMLADLRESAPLSAWPAEWSEQEIVPAIPVEKPKPKWLTGRR